MGQIMLPLIIGFALAQDKACVLKINGCCFCLFLIGLLMNLCELLGSTDIWRDIYTYNMTFWLSLLFIWMCWKSFCSKNDWKCSLFFSILTVSPMKSGEMSILCTCISTTDFYYSCTFFLKNGRKKNAVIDRHAGLICTLVDLCVVFGTPAEHVNVFGNSAVQLLTHSQVLHGGFKVANSAGLQFVKGAPCQLALNFYGSANQSYRRDPWMLTEVRLLKI